MLAAPMAPVSGGSHEVLLVNVTGVVTRGTLIHIEDALGEAEARGVPLVIQLDTPGGLVDATLDIDRAISRSTVPVLTFVGPRGGFAASAGTFILLMGHPSGMVPGTTIGSAQPIQSSPDGSTQPADDKVKNFLVERMRAIAERHDRDPDVAERFITENLNLEADEAIDTGMVEYLDRDVASFIRSVHGSRANVADGTWLLDTENARIVTYERGALAGLVDIIGNPQVSFILFLVGLYALIFGLANPGTYVPETIGALMLLLGIIGLGLFSTSTAGVLLLAVAGIFFVAEVFTPTHGVLTIVGVIALALGAVFLLDEPLLPASFLQTFFIVGLAAAVTSGAITFGAVTVALKARKLPTRVGLVGERARVLEDLQPEGRVTLRGEVWTAHLEDADGPPVPAGAAVEVVHREDLRLTVRPVVEESFADADAGAGAEGSRPADSGSAADAGAGVRPPGPGQEPQT